MTSLNWTVNKAIVNTSAIEWGYVDKDGNELKYTDAPEVATLMPAIKLSVPIKLIT